MAERKGLKLRRCTAASKNYYKLQYGRTDDNRKKRMQCHIRANPYDLATIHRYEFEKNFGSAQSVGVSAKGKALKKRAVREARV
jgi:hypothetical protein